MTRTSIDPFQGPAPQDAFTRLVPVDRLHMDPGPIARLFVDLGEAAAEEVICRALDDLIRRLDQLKIDHADCAFDRIAVGTRRIIAVADQLGQTEIAQVAAYVADCARADQAPALAATIARLGRISERVVADIWQARHPAQ